MADGNAQQDSLTGDVSAAASYVRVKIGAVTIQVPSDIPVEISVVANGNAPAPQVVTSAAPADISKPSAKAKPAPGTTKLLEVNDELEDGSICIAVDDRNNEALLAPACFFAGKSKHFAKDQDALVAQFNAWAARAEKAENKEEAKLAEDAKKQAHGHDDWRRITDSEGTILAEVWKKVAHGRPAEDFWLWSSFGNPENLQGQVRRGGKAEMWITDRNKDLWVPVVRTVAAVHTF